MGQETYRLSASPSALFVFSPTCVRVLGSAVLRLVVLLDKVAT